LNGAELSATLAKVSRGELVESTHPGIVVVADVTGRLLACHGDPEHVVYFRSAAKPFQAVPLVECGAADAFGFGPEELALACASHDATPAHQRGVARMLAKIGLDEDALRCGLAPPPDPQEAARITLGLKAPSQLQCECSGEHAGMLAACRHLGYPLESYIDPDHPLQRRIREIVAQVLRVSEAALVTATDGCRIPTFAAPVQSFAMAYATLANPKQAPAEAGRDLTHPLDRLREAMIAHPALVGGEATLDSDIMALSEGRIVAKLGAEGVLCLAVPERGLGIAIVADDGSSRALAPAAVGVIEQLELVEPKIVDTLRERHIETVKTFGGEAVGEMRPAFHLEIG
jgi:L-asparaginase II